MTRAEFIERLKKLIEEAENDERTAESAQNVTNDDSISRKAAIDALVKPKVIDVYDHYWDGRNTQYKNDVDAIADLPAAQPDWNEMIVICDCCGHAIHVQRQ